MIFQETGLKGCFVIKCNSYADIRGTFNKYYDLNEFSNHKLAFDIKQVNHSINLFRGTFRGLHYQNYPYNESKLIRCIKGAVLDFAVDLRKDSSTFLKYFSLELTEENCLMVLIPKGFAHGFITLKDKSELLYLHSGEYNIDADSGIRYNDPKINLKLPAIEIQSISEKDNNLPYIDNNFIGL